MSPMVTEVYHSHALRHIIVEYRGSEYQLQWVLEGRSWHRIGNTDAPPLPVLRVAEATVRLLGWAVVL